MVGYGKQVRNTGRCTGESAQLFCTCMKVFPAQMQKEMAVMLFGDVTDVLLMYIKGGYKSKCAWDQFFFSFFWSFHLVSLVCSPVSPSGKPQTLPLG